MPERIRIVKKNFSRPRFPYHDPHRFDRIRERKKIQPDQGLGDRPVTVCIAAICTWTDAPYSGQQMVVMAADRKYTVGDFTYEPNQTKRIPFSDSITGLIAGVMSHHAVIYERAVERFRRLDTANVRDAAALYADEFANFRRERAERILLSPIGLTTKALSSDPAIPSHYRSELTEEMRLQSLPDAAIIAGVDGKQTPHIYIVVDPGLARCEDAPGFAVVGSGADHAKAQLMNYAYSKAWRPARALFAVFAAKKRAEIEPHVGDHTDLFVIGPGDQPFSQLRDDVYDLIQPKYHEMRTNELEATISGFEDFDKAVMEILKSQNGSHDNAGKIKQIEPSPDISSSPNP